MRCYVGIDLHVTTVCSWSVEVGQVPYQKPLRNELALILAALEPIGRRSGNRLARLLRLGPLFTGYIYPKPNAQFCDHGNQYRSAVFYTTDEEKQLSEESNRATEQSNRLPAPIVTQLVKASTFYPAEDYHQAYYKKNPLRYKYYKYSCGRAQRLEALWGKP